MIERGYTYHLPCLLLLDSYLGDRFSLVCDMPGKLKKKIKKHASGFGTRNPITSLQLWNFDIDGSTNSSDRELFTSEFVFKGTQQFYKISQTE